MVTLDEKNLKCMMDQNASSVMFTVIKNEGFLRGFKRSLEFLQNYVHELKSEMAQIKKHEQK